jgi:hypothetical protein
MISLKSVELVFFQGCPHAAAARANLEAAFRELGRNPRWQEWDLEDPRIPSRLSGYASPTVLVDGRDVRGERTVGAAGGLACSSNGAPAVSSIVGALRGA